MANIKVRVQISEKSQIKTKKKDRKKSYPTCKGCGCRLIDPESIKIGYGPECYKNRVTGIIILEIPAGNDPIP